LDHVSSSRRTCFRSTEHMPPPPAADTGPAGVGTDTEVDDVLGLPATDGWYRRTGRSKSALSAMLPSCRSEIDGRRPRAHTHTHRERCCHKLLLASDAAFSDVTAAEPGAPVDRVASSIAAAEDPYRPRCSHRLSAVTAQHACHNNP